MTTAAAAASAAPPAVRRRLDRDDIVMRAGLVLLIGWMLVTLVLPLWALLSKSFQNQNGEFVGLANYLLYFTTPSLFDSVWNSLYVSLISTLIVLPLAFVYAYALQRSCMRWKGFFQALALIPILAPSLLPAISLVYLFGMGMHQAQGTTLAMLVPPVGLLAAWAYYREGYVDIHIAALLCAGSCQPRARSSIEMENHHDQTILV